MARFLWDGLILFFRFRELLLQFEYSICFLFYFLLIIFATTIHLHNYIMTLWIIYFFSSTSECILAQQNKRDTSTFQFQMLAGCYRTSSTKQHLRTYHSTSIQRTYSTRPGKQVNVSVSLWRSPGFQSSIILWLYTWSVKSRVRLNATHLSFSPLINVQRMSDSAITEDSSTTAFQVKIDYLKLTCFNALCEGKLLEQVKHQ